MKPFRFFSVLLMVQLAGCLPVQRVSDLEAVVPTVTKDILSCTTKEGWEFTLATSEAHLFLIYKKTVSFGFESGEDAKKEISSPISKFIHLGEVTDSKVAPKSLVFKTKMGPAEQSTDSLESVESSELEFRKIEAYIKGHKELEIDYKDPASKGKISLKGAGQLLSFESPFLVCSGPVSIKSK